MASWPRLLGGVLAGVLSFGLLIGLIHAQPDTYEEAYAFVRGGCEADTARAIPCWQGLRPGMATLVEAQALLSAHPWVEAIQLDASGAASYLSWRWSNAAPAFLRNAPAEAGPPAMWVQRDRVAYLSIPTDLTFAEVFRALGPPESGLFQVQRPARPAASSPLDQRQAPNVRHAAAYDRGQMVIETRLYCPAAAREFWDARVTLTLFDSGLMLFIPLDPYRLTDWLYSTPCPRPAA